ncbi:MAG TPA: glycosyltransferase, partial [Candidatus Limnocylindria bacterium]|nr:glycosyltransferase [Candidatus Limnocylindria bacterium]
VAQAFLGAKIHDPKDPGADLGPMFTQVVGTLLTLARKNAEIWRPVKGSRDVPVIGEISEVEPEPVNASVRILVEKFREGAAAQKAQWDEVFSSETRETARRATESGNASAIGARFWAKAVYEIVVAAKTREDMEALARVLLPLYFGRVAALIGEVQGLDQAGAERVVEQQALAFEQMKPYLLELWA